MLNLWPRIENSGAGAISNRSKTANAAAARRQRRRSGLDASALAISVMIVWAGTPCDVLADTIILKSGEAIEGSIIDATRNTVIIRRAIGGMRQMRIQEIEEVRIDVVQGQEISGQLLGWADDVYQVRSGGEVARISAGRVLSREPSEEAFRQPARELPPGPEEEPAVTTPDAPAASAPEEMAAPKAESQSETVAVKASVDPAEEGAHRMVFRIELSRPAEMAVVLIYGTIDGTAKAGHDYVPQQGVVTLAPGTKRADLHVPLIAHQRPRGGTRFELFLSANPKVAQVVDQRVIATIPGDD